MCHYEKSSSNVVVVDNTKMIDTVQTTTPRLNECCFIPTLTSVCQPCSLICITYHVSRTSQLVCNVCLCQSIPASSLRMMLSQLPMIGFLSNAGFRISTMLIDMYHESRTSKLVTTVCVCVWMHPRFESTNDVLTASPFNAHFPMSTMLDACVRQKYKMIDNTTCTSVEMYITGRRVQFRCCYRLIACKMIDSPHVPSILILLISSLAAWLGDSHFCEES